MVPFEQVKAKEYKKAGWAVCRNGWPDFLLYRFEGNKMIIKAIELKSINDEPRDNQWEVLEALAEAGIETSVIWEDGTEHKMRLPEGESNAR